MKKISILLLNILLTVKLSYGPSVDIQVHQINRLVKEKLLAENLRKLYSERFTGKNRKEVFYLVKPILHEYLKEYSNEFALNSDKLANVVSILFISESSTSKGYPATNSLFRKYNNPFGIKGNNVRLQTWEEINGQRVVMRLKFKKFSNLEHAVNYLITKVLLRKRFLKCRNSLSEKEFFKMMYQGGYMTSSYWHKFANKLLIQIQQ